MTPGSAPDWANMTAAEIAYWRGFNAWGPPPLRGDVLPRAEYMRGRRDALAFVLNALAQALDY